MSSTNLGKTAEAVTGIAGSLAKLPTGLIGPVGVLVGQIVDALVKQEDPEAAARKALTAISAKAAYRAGATKLAKAKK
jgi:hypothetical protein